MNGIGIDCKRRKHSFRNAQSSRRKLVDITTAVSPYFISKSIYILLAAGLSYHIKRVLKRKYPWDGFPKFTAKKRAPFPFPGWGKFHDKSIILTVKSIAIEGFHKNTFCSYICIHTCLTC